MGGGSAVVRVGSCHRYFCTHVLVGASTSGALDVCVCVCVFVIFFLKCFLDREDLWYCSSWACGGYCSSVNFGGRSGVCVCVGAGVGVGVGERESKRGQLGVRDALYEKKETC